MCIFMSILKSSRLILMYILLWILAVEALEHPYLAKLHDESDEPTCPEPFVVEVDELSLSEKDMKDIIYEESMRFNPDLRT